LANIEQQQALYADGGGVDRELRPRTMKSLTVWTAAVLQVERDCRPHMQNTL
jgi:hypothetical protein